MSNITKFLLLGAIAATVSACDTATGRAGGGALAGAALADATDENMVPVPLSRPRGRCQLRRGGPAALPLGRQLLLRPAPLPRR